MNDLASLSDLLARASIFGALGGHLGEIWGMNALGLLVQLSFIMLLLMTLFSLRKFRFGMLPLFVTLATFPYLQAYLCLTEYVFIYGPKDPANYYRVSPGSIVLFMATLYMVQLVYIYKDGIELRKLCTVLVCAIMLSTFLMSVFESEHNFKVDAEVFGSLHMPAWWVMLAGLFALLVDLLTLPCVYEMTRWLGLRSVYGRVLLTTLFVSWLDSAIFLAWTFLEGLWNPHADSDAGTRFYELFLAMAFARTVVCFLFTLAVYIYFEMFQWLGLEYKGTLGKPADVSIGDLIELFMYMIYIRDDYRPIRKKYSMDEEQNVFMFRPFDSEMSNAGEYSERSGNPTCLILVDVNVNGTERPRGTEGDASKVIGDVEKMINELAVGTATQKGAKRLGAGIEEFDLRLMSWGDGSEVPTSGSNLRIVGLDSNGLLRIRRFDATGFCTETFPEDASGSLNLRTVDADGDLLWVTSGSETQSRAISSLSQRLPDLLLQEELTGAERDRVSSDVTSILQAQIQPLVYSNDVDEIAVSLRDTGLSQGEEFAERIRTGAKSIRAEVAGRLTLSCGVAATDDIRPSKGLLRGKLKRRFPLEWRARMALDRDRQLRLNGSWHPKAYLFHFLQGKVRPEDDGTAAGRDGAGNPSHPDGRNGWSMDGKEPSMQAAPGASAPAAGAAERDRSTGLDPTWEMVAALKEENRRKDERIRALELRCAQPASPDLLMEDTYEGRVTEEQEEEVVVTYALPDDDFLEQVYGKSQFNHGASPSKDESIITKVAIYRYTAPDDGGESGDYHLYPREKLRRRIKL